MLFRTTYTKDVLREGEVNSLPSLTDPTQVQDIRDVYNHSIEMYNLANEHDEGIFDDDDDLDNMPMSDFGNDLAEVKERYDDISSALKAKIEDSKESSNIVEDDRQSQADEVPPKETIKE